FFAFLITLNPAMAALDRAHDPRGGLHYASEHDSQLVEFLSLRTVFARDLTKNVRSLVIKLKGDLRLVVHLITDHADMREMLPGQTARRLFTHPIANKLVSALL